MQFRKWILIGFLLVSSWGVMQSRSDAASDSLKLLLIYAAEENRVDENVHMIDATFSAFTTEQRVVSVQEFQPELLTGTDAVVLVGDAKMDLPAPLIKALDGYKGDMIAFGYNADQLRTFKGWDYRGEVELRSLDGHSLTKSISAVQVIPPQGSEIIVSGNSLNETIPFIIKNGRLSYIAATSFATDEKMQISKAMYPILGIDPPDVHPAYLRLEDISPVSDHQLVKETGDYLADRGIPFYMAVIPVYVNNETGEQMRLSANRKLVDVLRHLQDRGGIIIAHGYTHSYRYEETGEGFEFWDDQLNQKITTERTDKLPAPLPSRESFRSQDEFDSFMNEVDLIEKRYIERKHRKAIEDLVNLGLIPLAFEAPHYTMSSTGYGITSDYFTSIFGQVQLSDDNWGVMDAPLFISTPQILSGMTLYPETIGYADPTMADPLQGARESVKQLKEIPGSVVGGFYHPYLGLEYLPEMLELIYSVGPIEWLDLRTEEQIVKTDDILIHQQENGGLKVQSERNYWNRLVERSKEHPLEGALWLMAVVVALFLTAFFIYIASLRVGLKKRLFRERESIG